MRRVQRSDLRPGLKLHSYDVKRDFPVKFTVVGETDKPGVWTVRSDLLGIEVEATFEELADCVLAPHQENP